MANDNNKKNTKKPTVRKAVKKAAKPAASATPQGFDDEILLSLKNVKKRYGNIYGVNDISFDIEPGRIVAILGPDGSGKSSVARMICGLTPASKGEIKICGIKPSRNTKQYISFLPEIPFVNDYTKVSTVFRRYKAFFKDFDAEKAEKLIKYAGIKMSDTFGRMSATTMQKAQAIFVMCRKTRLYILDEPMTHIEPKARDFIAKLILSNMQDDSSVLIFSRIPNELEKIIDDVMFIHRGQIKLAGTVDEVKSEYGKEVSALYREVYKC
ncbi:MAG: ABC transporter ATP-binding protein [Firmicutes bacterium]|nr:ABC transporter ATP-binding protein [Bacillota bacterium]